MFYRIFLVIVGLFVACYAQAVDRYYVFGADEDSCVVSKNVVTGEVSVVGDTCLCIRKGERALNRGWKINWDVPNCLDPSYGRLVSGSHLLYKQLRASELDCEVDNVCTQYDCLMELYDTQRSGRHWELTENDCVRNGLPLLASDGAGR